MKKYYTSILQFLNANCVAVFALFFLLAQTGISQTVHKDCVDGQVYFKLKENVNVNVQATKSKVNRQSLSFMSGILSAYQVTEITKPFYVFETPIMQKTFRLDFADIENVDRIITDLYKTGMVEYAERVPLDTPDETFVEPFQEPMAAAFLTNDPAYTPNDPSYASKQSHLTLIKAPQAWDISKGDPKIAIAVADIAVSISHVDVKDNAWINPGEIANNSIDDDNNGYVDDVSGYDVADNDNDPNPGSTSANHGSHCGGIAAATSDNSLGIASIGFHCSLIGIKCAAGTGTGSFSAGYQGITYASKAKAKVVSCSWGSYTFSQTSQNVVNAAYALGIVIFATAGNDNQETKRYPCGYDNVYCVAATSPTDVKSSYSNYGAWVDISSPGNSIYSTVPTNTYASLSGTSMACPLVAGMAGLMFSLKPDMTQAQVLNCISTSSVNIDSKNASFVGKLGVGRINAQAAMQCVAALTPTGVKETDKEKEVRIYPNPGTGVFYIEKPGATEPDATVEVYSMLGMKVSSEKILNENGVFKGQVDIGLLPEGVYVITIANNEFKSVARIVKQ